PRFSRLIEKVRGAGPEASAPSCIQHETGGAAYPNEHINPTLRDISSYIAMEGLSPTAKLEHLAQDSDSAARRRVLKDIHHRAHRVRIRVVAIVINRDPVMP